MMHLSYLPFKSIMKISIKMAWELLNIMKFEFKCGTRLLLSLSGHDLYCIHFEDLWNRS